MFKLYRDFYNAQIRWIHKHPVQYIVLNVGLTVVFVGYMEYRDRKEMRELANEAAAEES